MVLFRQGPELGLVLLDRPVAGRPHEDAMRITAGRWTKRLLYLVGEVWPRRGAVVLLQTVIPFLSSTFHVEGCEPHPLAVRHAVGAEELLYLVKPDHRVDDVVVARKTELVIGMLARQRGVSLPLWDPSEEWLSVSSLLTVMLRQLWSPFIVVTSFLMV